MNANENGDVNVGANGEVNANVNAPGSFEGLLGFLHDAERLKSVTRHSWTSSGRRESVAEHCWRMALFALALADRLPGIDAGRVIELSLVHDLGEVWRGDTPDFGQIDEAARQRAEQADMEWLTEPLPPAARERIRGLWREFHEGRTPEARLAIALDKMEVCLQHDEADLSTWLPLEFDLNLVYGRETAAFDPTVRALREAVDAVTRRRLAENSPTPNQDSA